MGPKLSSGFIIPKNGPITRPAIDMTTIAGKLNFQATHWEPIPNTPINIIASKRDISIRIFTYLSDVFNVHFFRYKEHCNHHLYKSKEEYPDYKIDVIFYLLQCFNR